MTYRRELNLANQPALVPLFGGLDKKPRPLDRDVIAVGRARGCDLKLDAPEISTLHCILHRTAEGFRVRDCGSRTGIRVNGEVPRHAVLVEGDVLQIGPFSFRVSVPPAAKAEQGKQDAAGLERLQKSRRNLVQLAVRLRRRLQDRAERGGLEEHKAAELRKRIRHYDERAGQLEAAERDLEKDREQLGRERESHLARVQQVEGELAKRLEAADQEIHARWQAFQQRCQHEEQARQRELEKHQREREEAMITKDQHVAEQAETSAFLEKQRAALGQAEAALREQRSELGRMMGDLRALQEAIKKQQGANVQALTSENEELRRMLDEYERRLVELVDNRPADLSKDVADLKAENEELRQLLAEKEGLMNELRERVEKLQAQPKVEAAAPRESMDLESYEAELNQYRQQLEVDRAKLNKEIEQLRSRNAELDDATREMEMEMSKERAELGRERIRLDRLREEVRSELERIQRDATMKESLAPVHKLREEMIQKKGAGKEDGNRLTDRLHNFRNRLTDAQ